VIYDLSVPLQPGLPTYDAEPGPELTPLKTLAADGVNVSQLSLGVHSGTHVDAPVHFISGGGGVDQVPLEAMLGPCLVIEHPGTTDITADDLERAALPFDAARLIFKTRNSALWADPDFRCDFLALERSAADWLVGRGVLLVGIDYLSVDPYGAEPQAAHLLLLRAGVVIVEGLDLRGVPPGPYTLACLPLRLVGADGAPARVVLSTP
jgi:arylformamidase